MVNFRQLSVAQWLALRCRRRARILLDGKIESTALIRLRRAERCYDQICGERAWRDQQLTWEIFLRLNLESAEDLRAMMEGSDKLKLPFASIFD